MIFCKIHQAPCFEKAELPGLAFLLSGLWKAMSGICEFGDLGIWGFVAHVLRPLQILCARCGKTILHINRSKTITRYRMAGGAMFFTATNPPRRGKRKVSAKSATKISEKKKSAKICAEDLRKSAGNTSAPKICSKFRRVFPQICADLFADERRFIRR
jgi:hypothetical protein